MWSFDHVFTLISYLQTLLLYLLFHFCFSPTCMESIRFSWRFNTIFQIIGSKVPFLGILTKMLGGLKIFRSVLMFENQPWQQNLLNIVVTLNAFPKSVRQSLKSVISRKEISCQNLYPSWGNVLAWNRATSKSTQRKNWFSGLALTPTRQKGFSNTFWKIASLKKLWKALTKSLSLSSFCMNLNGCVENTGMAFKLKFIRSTAHWQKFP